MDVINDYVMYQYLKKYQSNFVKLMVDLMDYISPERINEMSQLEINEFIQKYDEFVEKHEQYSMVFNNYSENEYVKQHLLEWHNQINININKIHMLRNKFE